MKIRKALTYDDVLLVPKYSDISSRQSIDLTTQFTKNYKVKLPFVSAPMDTVTEYEMVTKLLSVGAVGILHRFMSIDEQVQQVKNIVSYIGTNRDHLHSVWGELMSTDTDLPITVAIGVSDIELSRARSVVDAGTNILLIDVAHGHHKNVKDMVQKLRSLFGNSVDIIAGNVATKEGAEFLVECGVDGIRANIGNGSLCTTRVETGHGIPSITSLQDVVSGADGIPVIADGGIRYTGDIAKALSIGPDTVMLGSLFAGTHETPGEFIETNGSLYKRYRGSASLETKVNNNQSQRNVEGESTIVSYKGGVKYVIKKLEDGIRSAFSYSGANNIWEFRDNSELIQVTAAGHVESKPHLKIK